jgi:hypothetical protein
MRTLVDSRRCGRRSSIVVPWIASANGRDISNWTSLPRAARPRRPRPRAAPPPQPKRSNRSRGRRGPGPRNRSSRLAAGRTPRRTRRARPGRTWPASRDPRARRTPSETSLKLASAALSPGVDVGVVLSRELAVRRLQLFLVRGARDAQDLVVIPLGGHGAILGWRPGAVKATGVESFACSSRCSRSGSPLLAALPPPDGSTEPPMVPPPSSPRPAPSDEADETDPAYMTLLPDDGSPWGLQPEMSEKLAAVAETYLDYAVRFACTEAVRGEVHRRRGQEGDREALRVHPRARRRPRHRRVPPEARGDGASPTRPSTTRRRSLRRTRGSSCSPR